MGRVELPEGYTDWGSIFMPPTREPAVYNEVVFIKLTQGYVTVCDVEDLEDVRGHIWRAQTRTRGGRLDRVSAGCGLPGHVHVQLHRYILDPEQSSLVDHRNLDALDNRRHNLRPVDNTKNKQNGRVYNNSKTGYKGVFLRGQGYLSYIRVNKTLVRLGKYTTPEAAALAYNRAAIEYFGEFARLNVVPEGAGGNHYIYQSNTGYKGVYEKKGMYYSTIWVEGALRPVGKFNTPEEAARAWNAAAIKYRGPNTRLNVIP